MVHQAYGEINFPNSIMVSSYNNSMNITTEENSRIFDCAQNTSSVYTFTLRRNVSDCGDVKNLNNNIDRMISTCDSFSQQYGDVSKYFSLYSTCNVENEICKKDRTERDKNIAQLNSYKSGYESLTADMAVITGNVIPAMRLNITELHTNNTMCQQSLVTESNNKILWFFGGMMLIGAFWGYQKRKDTHITKRSRVPLR